MRKSMISPAHVINTRRVANPVLDFLVYFTKERPSMYTEHGDSGRYRPCSRRTFLLPCGHSFAQKTI